MKKDLTDLVVNVLCSHTKEKHGHFEFLLSINCCKRFLPLKIKPKRIQILISHVVPTYMLFIAILIAQTMKLMSVMLLNLFAQCKISQQQALLLSRFIIIGKKKLIGLLLTCISVKEYLMNRSKMSILKYLILFHHSKR